MNASSKTLAALQFCGGADMAILRQCREGIRAMFAVRGAICLIVAVISAIFAGNTWGSISGSIWVGVAVFLGWAALIGLVNWCVGYTRDRPSRNWATALLSFCTMLVLYTFVTAVNLTFTLMYVHQVKIAEIQQQHRVDNLKPLTAALDAATAAREAEIRRLNGQLATATANRDSGVLSNQRRFEQLTAAARQHYDARVVQLEGAVQRLQENLQEASRRLSGEVTGEVVKGGKTTGIRGDGKAAEAVRAEVAKLDGLLAAATTTRDEQMPILVAELASELDRLTAERDTASIHLERMYAAATAANTAGKAEAQRVWEVAKTTHDRDVAQAELVTQDGFKTRFNALRNVLLDDPWSMAPFVLLIFFLETLPFWFTFVPAKEYHERLRLQDLQTAANIAREEQSIVHPTPTMVRPAADAGDEDATRRSAA